MKTNSSQKIVIIVLAVLLVLALIFGGFQLSRSSALRTQLGSVQDTLEAKNAELAAASDELESTKSTLADLTTSQQQDEELAEALRAKESELEATKAELEALIAAQEETASQQDAAAAAQQEAATAAQSAADTALEAAKAELETVKAELEAVKAELAELSAKQQETADALSAKEAELETAVTALNDMTAKQQDTENALNEMTAKQQDTENALNEITAKQQDTENALAEATAVHQHVWGEWVIDIEPGCESEGREIRRCETEPSDEETRLIPALGHDWSPATFTQPKKCSRCGEVSGSSSPESSFPTMEDVRFLSRNSAITRVSNTDKTALKLPAESSYLSEPYRAKLSNNIYIMPIPELGHGHLGIVDKGTDVVVVAKRNGYVFFVTYDGRMGWNGSQLVG